MDGEIDLGIDGLVDYKEIGSGGFATVYSAFEEDAARLVAVKVLHSLDENGRRRFDRERRTMGLTTEHPNIVTMFRSGYTATGNHPYLVMEHLSGGSLQDEIDSSGALPTESAIRTIALVAEALSYAHSSGIVHKDIKPANILISGTGHVKLADFGIAAIKEATTQTSQIAFSMAYTAPETFGAGRDTQTGAAIDPRDDRSDLYSLAISLYAIIVGRVPFEAANPAALMRQILVEPVPATGDTRLDDFLSMATAKHPSDRYATASQFARALERLGRPTVDTETIVAPPSPALPIDGIGIAEIEVELAPLLVAENDSDRRQGEYFLSHNEARVRAQIGEVEQPVAIINCFNRDGYSEVLESWSYYRGMLVITRDRVLQLDGLGDLVSDTSRKNGLAVSSVQIHNRGRPLRSNGGHNLSQAWQLSIQPSDLEERFDLTDSQRQAAEMVVLIDGQRSANWVCKTLNNAN